MKHLVILALLLVGGSAAAAPNCSLQRISSGDMVVSNLGAITGVTIGDQKLAFIVDTRLLRSVMFDGFVTQMGLPFVSSSDYYVDIDAHPLFSYTKVPKIILGQMVYPVNTLLVAHRSLEVDGKPIAGVLGSEMLNNYDVEMDPTLGKLNFYLQDHCAGQVVYWAKEYFASPMHRLGNRQVEMDVELDGQPLHAVLSTGIGDNLLQLKAASKRFGLDEHSPGMTAAAPVTDLSGYPIQTYDYQFKTLKFGELTINNPRILVAATGTQPVVHTHLDPDFTADLLIGMNFLKKFHLYFAYGEDKIYYTLAK